MNNIITKILDIIFERLMKYQSFYGFFYFLYLRGMKGIEQGYNYGEVTTSGELRVLDILKQAEAPVIIDGGANKGQYALSCAEKLNEKAKIFSFEPSKFTFQTLQKNTAAHNNIFPVNLALSNAEQTLTLYYDEVNSGLASLVKCNFELYDFYLDKKEEVSATTLDRFAAEKDLRYITLLKLDLEGYEFIALQGSKELIKEGKIEMIQFEMGRPNVDAKIFFKDFFYLLRDQYRFYRILSYGLIQIPEYSYEFEIFLGSNYLAVHKLSKVKINAIF